MTEPHMLTHTGDPDTSKAAAAIAALSPSSAKLKAVIIELLDEHHALSATELQRFYIRDRLQHPDWPEVQPHSVNRRLSDLVQAGIVRDTGRRQRTPWNRDEVVWERSPNAALERLLNAHGLREPEPAPTKEAPALPEVSDVVEAIAWKLEREAVIGSQTFFVRKIREEFGSLESMLASVAAWREATS